MFFQNWHIYNPGWGKKTREDNTEQYTNWCKKPNRDWMLYAWKDSKKSKFQSLAKRDRFNDQVRDARKGRVIGMEREESMGGNETK